jgi:hypothetical protein
MAIKRDLRVSYHRISFASQILELLIHKFCPYQEIKKSGRKSTIPKTAPTSPHSNIARNRITSNLHHKLPYTSNPRQTQIVVRQLLSPSFNWTLMWAVGLNKMPETQIAPSSVSRPSKPVSEALLNEKVSSALRPLDFN